MLRSSVPSPAPSTQSVTFAPVRKGGSEVLSRTRQGIGPPPERGRSSRKLSGVPLSSNAALMSNTIAAAPLPQVSLSSA
jgi:hypothetical protein